MWELGPRSLGREPVPRSYAVRGDQFTCVVPPSCLSPIDCQARSTEPRIKAQLSRPPSGAGAVHVPGQALATAAVCAASLMTGSEDAELGSWPPASCAPGASLSGAILGGFRYGFVKADRILLSRSVRAAVVDATDWVPYTQQTLYFSQTGAGRPRPGCQQGTALWLPTSDSSPGPYLLEGARELCGVSFYEGDPYDLIS